MQNSMNCWVLWPWESHPSSIPSKMSLHLLSTPAVNSRNVLSGEPPRRVTPQTNQNLLQTWPHTYLRVAKTCTCKQTPVCHLAKAEPLIKQDYLAWMMSLALAFLTPHPLPHHFLSPRRALATIVSKHYWEKGSRWGWTRWWAVLRWAAGCTSQPSSAVAGCRRGRAANRTRACSAASWERDAAGNTNRRRRV